MQNPPEETKASGMGWVPCSAAWTAEDPTAPADGSESIGDGEPRSCALPSAGKTSEGREGRLIRLVFFMFCILSFCVTLWDCKHVFVSIFGGESSELKSHLVPIIS